MIYFSNKAENRSKMIVTPKYTLLQHFRWTSGWRPFITSWLNFDLPDTIQPYRRCWSKKLSGRWRCFQIKRFRSFHRIGSIWTRSFRSLNKKIQHGIQDRQSTWPWLSYNTTYIPSISYSSFTQPWLKLLSRVTKFWFNMLMNQFQRYDSLSYRTW